MRLSSSRLEATNLFNTNTEIGIRGGMARGLTEEKIDERLSETLP